MKTGRNDPCPCGSGEKYKKCCLGKNQAAATSSILTPPTPSRPRPATPPPMPASSATPPPRPRTPAEERWGARWHEFESQEGEGRIAIFLQTLGDKELMDDEMAFEMLQHLHQDAVQRGERVRFAGLVGALREQQPEVYEEGAHYYLSWCLQDDLAEGRADDVLPRARELGARAGRAIDTVNRSLQVLAYHGQLSVLVEAMRVAWPSVKSSDDIVPWGISEFAGTAADYEIYNYLEHTASPNPDDPVLLDHVKFFVAEPRLDYLAKFIGDLTGQATPAWTVDAFALRPPQKKTRHEWSDRDDDDEQSEPPPDPAADNLSRLISQFVGYLRREEGVSFARGELVRQELYRYFMRRHAGELDPRPSMLEQARHPNKKLPPPPKPGHPLCPERVTLEVQLTRLVGFLNGLHHTAAALFEVVPAWLRFLESRRLIDADRRVRTVDELRPLHAALLRLWKKYTEDPTLSRAAQAWPANAATGLASGMVQESRSFGDKAEAEA